MVGPNDALKKLQVRQTLNYAVNKRNIVQVVGASKVVQATGQISNESVVGSGFTVQDEHGTTDFAGDPAKAAARCRRLPERAHAGPGLPVERPRAEDRRDPGGRPQGVRHHDHAERDRLA